MKRKFTKDFMVETLGLPYEPSGEVEVIKDEIYDTSRWSSHHELIFKFENKYYQTDYSEGLTEHQDESPWEYDKIVECVEVEPFEKVVVDYRPIEDGE